MQGGGWTTIDRVLELEPGKSARGLRNVPNTLTILDSHFPRFPVLPGVLSLGSLGELSARLLKEQTGRCWRMTGAEQVRFRHFIQPGDQMELRVEIKSISDDTASLTGSISVDGKVVTTARQLRFEPDDLVSGQ
jgi:3-hydroxyacyl-[acyl-carrier-protein] dehydratase